LKNGTFLKTPQDKIVGNNWRKRSIKDGLIDFRMSSSMICNLVKALTKPYVGAHLEFSNSEIKVWEVELNKFDVTQSNIEPGKVLNVIDDKIEVKTGDSAIWLINHEFTELPKIGSYIL
jgi:methionyl-tRNA formyltransferase